MLRSIQWKPVLVCINCVSMNDSVLWVLLLNMIHKGGLPMFTGRTFVVPSQGPPLCFKWM